MILNLCTSRMEGSDGLESASGDRGAAVMVNQRQEQMYRKQYQKVCRTAKDSDKLLDPQRVYKITRYRAIKEMHKTSLKNI